MSNRAEIKLLRSGDESALERVAQNLFDNKIDPALAAEFLRDPRHHLAVAVEDGIVVGFASAVHYVHPDKPPELWINEVSVAPSHRRHGLARQLLRALFDLGRNHQCVAAWVATDHANLPAMKLYASAGEGLQSLEDSVIFTFPLATR